MQLAFGLPFVASAAVQLTKNCNLAPSTAAAMPPMALSVTPPALERVVPVSAPHAQVRPASLLPLDRASLQPFLADNQVNEGPLSLRAKNRFNDLPEKALPKSLLPFPTKTHPRKDLKPLGAVVPRNDQERWFQARLADIASANPDAFAGVSLCDIRITYDPNSERLASVGTEGLEITFGPKAYELTQDDQELTAIFCHEISHILLGHQSFSTAPPDWVQASPPFRTAHAQQKQARKMIDIHGLKARYASMADLESVLREQMRRERLSGGEAVSNAAISTAQIKAYAAQSSSAAAKQYRHLLKQEAAYQQQVARWRASVQAEFVAADRVMGEPGASANWREEQADILGLRLFLKQGGQPEDFFNALVRTLSRKDPGLVDYTQSLFSAEDLKTVPAPPRGDERHPSPRWRVYNLLVRELHVRYPKAYLNLLAKPLPPAANKGTP